MIAVTQPAARPWDGRRLLRFLTGLAVLALAVTLRLPGPVPATEAAESAPAVTSVTTAGASTPDSTPVVAELPEPVVAPAPGIVTFATPLFAALALPGGVHPGTHGSRAPPAL